VTLTLVIDRIAAVPLHYLPHTAGDRVCSSSGDSTDKPQWSQCL